MERTIEGFHRDDRGDWVAELSCLHNQHVRHRPPFQDRAWVEDSAGREGRLGTAIECPLCDRGQMPEGLALVRTLGPFDAATLPSGLRRDHRIAARVWARLRVLDGDVRLSMGASPRVVHLSRGDSQPIPPDVLHHVDPAANASLTIDFFT